MQTKPIFFDPSGKRQKLFTTLGSGATLGTVLLAALFLVSLLIAPLLPVIPGLSGTAAVFHRPMLQTREGLKAHDAQFLLKRSLVQLQRSLVWPISTVALPPQETHIVAGFYAPWQKTGMQSLRANAAKMTHLMPEWLHLDAKGDAIDLHDWNPHLTPANLEVVRLARDNKLQIFPILNNASGGQFDPRRVHALLGSTSSQQAVARSMRNWLVQQKFQGVNIDFENLASQDQSRFPAFIKLLQGALRAANLSVSVDVEANVDKGPLKAIAQECDFVILMAYDQHYLAGQPGPIAAVTWSNALVEKTLRVVPANKLVLGLGNYAYDWTEDTNKPASALTYQSALNLVTDNRAGEDPRKVIDFDPEALNTTFEYRDENNAAHEVWMLDAVSAYNQWLMGQHCGLRGAALWSLGAEDPSIWHFFDQRRLYESLHSDSLQTVCFPYEVMSQGDGEILSVLSTPKRGSRHITTDEKTGLCSDMEYVSIPSAYVLQRSGYKPRTIALTFDDGPSSQYTPAVLDELKKLDVPATFFVIGENAERYPALVQRMWDEGDEIGNHTFTHPNLGAINPRRVELELNATQRAIESITGHSTMLFRPPYNADAEPQTGEEVRPVLAAAGLHYITVGELLDPEDWNLWTTRKDGSKAPRTTDELIASIYHEVKSAHGNMLLLHDAGGDRSQTIEALGAVVPRLQKLGYRFVTVSQLLGKSRDTVMPVLSAKDRLLVRFDKCVFLGLFTAERFMEVGFMLAVVLGIGRITFVTLLACFAGRGHRPTSPYRGMVSVLIAAYNERPVIVRSIRSILDSEYPTLEVIVVDDGSLDGTGDEVEAAFAGDPRVRLIRQPNGGKAVALNNAAAYANGEVLVCFDADTQVARDAVSLLARHFNDESVAAVAGNIKVGNRTNLLTRWQAIEYITSQNVERKALGLLNAITVIPGAIGAWRREAVLAVGGYTSDTLAEDMDLTWRLRRAGWKLITENAALAYTEAPDSLKAFFKQRFRWSYGTLQCLWKHRAALGHEGWFGCLALPSLWLFQFGFQLLAPLVDLQLLSSFVRFLYAWLVQGYLYQDPSALPASMGILIQTGTYCALFFGVEMMGAVFAFRSDRERLTLLWYSFWQRLVYRQLMYLVVWRALFMAAGGLRQGWGKLQRKGTVEMADAGLRQTSRAC